MNITALNLLQKRLRFFSISSLLLAGLFVTPIAFAVDAPPPPPMDAGNADQPEPDDQITIIQKKETTIEEHRVNGQLRYAKITPNKGAPYYMFDSDGDGVLDTRNNNIENPPIQQWILFRW